MTSAIVHFNFRALGADHHESVGTFEHVQAMAPRTMDLFERRADEMSLDEYERLGI